MAEGATVLVGVPCQVEEAKVRILRNAVMMRGIAAILIVGKHTLGRALTSSDRLLLLFSQIADSITDCAVPTFLILSGFTLSLAAGRKVRFRKYLKIVATKILPAYTVWYFVYRVLWSAKHAVPVSPVELVREYLTLTDSWQLWFLVLLAQLYLLFPLLYRLYSTSVVGKALFVLLIVVLHIGGGLLGRLGPSSLLQAYFAPLFSSYTLYFVLGFYVCDYAPLLVRYARKHAALAACVATYAATKVYEVLVVLSPPFAAFERSFSEVARLFHLLNNSSAFVLLFALSGYIWTRGNRTKRYLSAYGLYSYGVYLAHVIPMAFTYTALRLVVGADNYVVLAGNLLAAVVLSKIFVQWLTKMPLSGYYT